jgi:hypothetical protein
MTLGHLVTQPWVNFFFFYIYKKIRLKLRVNLKFYKSLRGIKIISLILSYDPNEQRRYTASN